ncbi:MAG: trypsin-like peptidase domain-containing protein [Candidatus Doudnabacteria bacterium]
MTKLNNEKALTSDLPEAGESSIKLITLVVLLSFLFGIGGAVFGSTFLLHNGVSFGSGIGSDIKTVSVNEQSGIVDVVKNASPAVVSIIISKDLNKIPGYSTSPFDFGPFSFDPFFQNRNQQNQKNNTPNIQQIGGGSGFIVSSDGLIMTNKHVVADTTATYTVLTNDGKKYDATVLSRDPVNDLALVKISASQLPTLPLGDSSGLRIGQTVIAIGNSLGQYSNTVTKGIVSGIGRTITAGGETGSDSEQLEGVIQTDAAINPGNSGGPLLDIGGSVIGINTAMDSQGQLIGFAIPVNDIKKDISSFQKVGRIVKPFLGVRYVMINQSIQQQNNLSVDHGALIVSGDLISSPAVLPGSAADKAGLKEHDIIQQINGKDLNQDHSLASYLKDFNPGDVVKMTVFSGGKTKDLTVTLGESK